MLSEFVLETIAGPGSGLNIALTGAHPAGRIAWSVGFPSSQPVFYVLDDGNQMEWGTGYFTTPGAISRDNVIGNTNGDTARLYFGGTTTCYSGLPLGEIWAKSGGTVGRNFLLNAMMRVRQRGSGPFNGAVGITADRWTVYSNNGTRSITFPAITDADRIAIGDEEATTALQYVFAGSAVAASYEILAQNLETVRRLSGKTITVSFWAKAMFGGLRLGVAIVQSFGTSGSPSASLRVATAPVTLATTWTRYAVTLAVPSAIGKTFGTDAGSDYTRLEFWPSTGTTNAPLMGIGVQSGTIQFWGLQLEIGQAPSPLEKIDYQSELALCQRHCQYLTRLWMSGRNTTGGPIYADFVLPVRMRAQPTVTIPTPSADFNCSDATVNVLTAQHLRLQMLVTATGFAWQQGDVILSAEQ